MKRTRSTGKAEKREKSRNKQQALQKALKRFLSFFRSLLLKVVSKSICRFPKDSGATGQMQTICSMPRKAHSFGVRFFLSGCSLMRPKNANCDI